MAFAISLINMWFGNFDTSTWFIPVNLACPFDTSTIFGWYMMLLLFQIPCGFAFLLSITAIVTHFVSCCLYIIACCDHFKLKIQNLDQMIAKISDEHETNQENNKMNALIVDIISTHIDIIK